MWISNKIALREKSKERKASSADVTLIDGGNIVVQNSNEYRGIKVVSPRGIAYMPVQGDKTVVIPVGDENVCIGAINESAELEAGELMLYSSGGAKIVLKNNGEVLINNTTIPAIGG